MIRYLIFILSCLFISAQVMACPNLKGTYVCANGGDVIPPLISIDQKINENGINLYAIIWAEFIADGVLREDPYIEHQINKVSCVDQSLVLNAYHKTDDSELIPDDSYSFNSSQAGDLGIIRFHQNTTTTVVCTRW